MRVLWLWLSFVEYSVFSIILNPCQLGLSGTRRTPCGVRTQVSERPWISAVGDGQGELILERMPGKETMMAAKQ